MSQARIDRSALCVGTSLFDFVPKDLATGPYVQCIIRKAEQHSSICLLNDNHLMDATLKRGIDAVWSVDANDAETRVKRAAALFLLNSQSGQQRAHL
jgi:hypothetical protein